ncbi:MAG TPA: VTT domain-containing protein [Actinomycetes bacterium]
MHVTALGPSWLDPNTLVDNFGLVGVVAVIFAECGLLAGFFLPGDSLLFTAGLLVKQGTMSQPIWLVCLLVTVAAVAGNQVGYLIGRKAGPAIFNRPDSRLFKQEYVDKAYAFFDRYGARAIVLARFVPIVRTFITVIAGVGKMDYRTYSTYTFIGGVLWGTGVTMLGYALGGVDFVAEHIELILVGIVALSVIPVAFELMRARSRSRDTRYDEPEERARVEQEQMHPED